MKTLKVLGSLFVLLFVVSLYLNGCAPAETTTGKLAYQQKNWEKAATELQKGLNIDKSDAEAWYMLGYSQIELGRYDEAAKSFQQARTLSSQYNNLITSYWIDKYNAGISDFNAGVKALSNKDNTNANKNFQSAINNFTAATSILPDSIAAFQLLADSYSNAGQPDKALEIYENIITKSNSKEDAIMIAKILYQNGLKLRQQEEFEKSIDVFKQAISINLLPKDNIYYEAAMFNIGIANYQIASKLVTEGKGKTEYEPYLNESVKYLDELVSTSKNNDILKDAYEILYSAYDGLGNKAKSEEALNKKNALK